MKRLRCVLAVCLIPLGPAAADADVPTFASRKAEADASFVADLAAVAQWAERSKLHGRRDAVYETILEFAPDHDKARRVLKYARAADGGWRQDPRYKLPRDWNPKLLDDFAARRERAGAAWRDAVLAVCADAATSEELSWAAATVLALRERRPQDEVALRGLKAVLLRHLALLRTLDLPVALEEVTGRLQAHLGSDPDVRRAFGEVESGGRWLLPATVRARGVRKAVLAAAGESLAAVPAVSQVPPTDAERAAGGAGTVYATDHLRVLGTTSAASLESIARHCEAAGPFFDRVFGVQAKREPTRTFFVFTQLVHWTEFLEAYPPLSPERRADALKATGSGYPLASNAYACLPVGRPAAELDLCVDVTFQTLLNEAFSKWHAERRQWQVLPGWVRVGVSDYLTWRLTGKRILTTVGGEDKYDAPKPETGDRSPKANTAWLAAALDTLRKQRAPGTHLMLGKDLAAFAKDDALTSFGLASYLVEGRPEDAARVLTEVGTGRGTAEVAREVLGLTVEALHVELARWLEETIAENG